MTTFALLSALVTTAAIFGLISYRVLRLPTTVGTTALSLLGAAALIALGHVAPGLRLTASGIVARIDFNAVVLHGMLAFLLFAGALQLNLHELSRQKLTVASLSVVATALSTVLVAALFKYALLAFGIHLSTLTALLFGALISPTDPIAVLEMLHRIGVPASLESHLAGESLFNDGVGAVIFLALLDASTTGALPSPSRVLAILLLKALGAAALGAVLGFLAYRLILLVDSYRIEVLLTLALAMGGYALADALHLSAPIEVVVAGLLVNGRARRFAMSDQTRANLDTFWELLDDIFNVVLFLLLGLELLVLPLEVRFLEVGLLAVPLVLLARFLSVGSVMQALALVRRPIPGSVFTLTWGGLRGALAVALALALPSGPGSHRGLLLVTTYVVVMFSILVQGLTLTRLLARFGLRTRVPA